MMVSNRTLLIFDCDGVLVDSEPISIAVLTDAIRDAGIDMSDSDAYRLFLGRSLSTLVDVLNADFGLSVGDDFLDAMRVELYARFRRDLRPIRGVTQALRHLQVDRCVASSSQIERIRLSLTLTGLIDFFEPNIFSSSMVARGKPEPDLFFHAAAEMGHNPADCIVIEDSPAGIAAAKAAGMRVFAFVGGTHATAVDLRGQVSRLNPDLIFDEMSRLPELLGATAE